MLGNRPKAKPPMTLGSGKASSRYYACLSMRGMIVRLPNPAPVCKSPRWSRSDQFPFCFGLTELRNHLY